MGAWIEIGIEIIELTDKGVAPFMGAWIEIDLEAFVLNVNVGRTLYGCVD